MAGFVDIFKIVITMITQTKNIYLLGFSPFEKTAFESFFRLSARRTTHYKIVPAVADAEVLLVSGDNAAAVAWTKASIASGQKALFFGKPDASGRWPTAARPIKLMAVLDLLDMLVNANKPPPSVTPTTVVPAQNNAGIGQKAAISTPVTQSKLENPALNSVRSGSGSAGGRSRSISSFGASNFMGLGAAPEPISSAQQFDNILVVDDSDIALKFMQNRLTRYGFRAQLVSSGEEALTCISTKDYKFVFMDVMMEGLDGYQTCRAIKQRKYAKGTAPVVVMLTSRGGSIDKIRGGLAGCDAYLTKPLNEAELLKVLSKYDEQVERSFRETSLGDLKSEL